MPMIVMLHGANHVPNVWRAVSDSFPASWGVVAPQLHGRTDVEHMAQAIANDLHSIDVQPPVIVVAYAEGAIPAAEFCARNGTAHDIAGLLIADPRIAVTPAHARIARVKAAVRPKKKSSGKRAHITDSSSQQRAEYLSALAGKDATAHLEQIAHAEIPVRIVAAEKDSIGTTCAKELHQQIRGSEFFPIAGAEPGWNAYAPSYFAANIVEFVQQIQS